jgi:hypothetical protein
MDKLNIKALLATAAERQAKREVAARATYEAYWGDPLNKDRHLTTRLCRKCQYAGLAQCHGSLCLNCCIDTPSQPGRLCLSCSKVFDACRVCLEPMK